jgi:hypothetical protein
VTEATNEPGSSGLLDSVTVEDSSKPTEPTAAAIPHREADPSAPAQEDPLERPDYWPENFWKKDANEPDLEGIAKSWRDLRAKISKGHHNAPADGKYDMATFGETADENPMAQELAAFAKDNGLSQAQFDDLATRLRTKATELMDGERIDPTVEMKKLGPNANAMVNGMVDWARGLVNKGVWAKEDFEEFKIMGGTAQGLRALMKIREAYEGRLPIETSPIEGAPSKEELYQMVGDPRYKTDAAYRQKVERLFKAVIQ